MKGSVILKSVVVLALISGPYAAMANLTAVTSATDSNGVFRYTFSRGTEQYLFGGTNTSLGIVIPSCNVVSASVSHAGWALSVTQNQVILQVLGSMVIDQPALTVTVMSTSTKWTTYGDVWTTGTYSCGWIFGDVYTTNHVVYRPVVTNEIPAVSVPGFERFAFLGPATESSSVLAFEAGRGANYGQVQLSWSNGLATILACTNRTYSTNAAHWFVLASGVVPPWTHTAASNFPSVYYRIVSGTDTSQYAVGKFDVNIAAGSIAWLSFPFGVQAGCNALSEWFGRQLEARPSTGYNYPSLQNQNGPGGVIQNSDYYVSGVVTNWNPDRTVGANAGYVLFLPQNHPGVKVTGIGMVQTNNVTMQIPYKSIPWVSLAYDVIMDMRASGMTSLFTPPQFYSTFNYDYVDSQQTLGGPVWYAEYYRDNWGTGATNFFPSVTGADKLEPGKGYLLFFSTARSGTGTWTCVRPY